MLEKYAEFCFNQIGKTSLKVIDYFEHLRPQLEKAGIDISLVEYLAAIIFTALIVGITSFLVLPVLLAFSIGVEGFFLGLIIALLITVIAPGVFYLYPSIMISDRSTKINDKLPFATLYLSTLAGTGTPTSEIFENLSELEEYGEIAKEANKIYRDTQLGMDINQALERSAQRSPSEDYKDLMWGMNHVLATGGSLREFLRSRSEQYMSDYERRVKEFSDQLSLLVQIYITLFIVGSIVFTAMSAIITVIGTGVSGTAVVLIQLLSIFIGLPLISIMFIILVDGLAPGGIN